MRKEDGLEQYFKEIGKIPLLSHQEEVELVEKLKEGMDEKNLRKKLVVSNLRLVISVAKKYVRRGLPLMDLIEEGNLGLIRASEKFNPHMGCRFSTYGIWWIKQSIKRALIDTVKTIRIPSYMVALLGKWNQIKRELTLRLNRTPYRDEIAKVLNLTEDQKELVEAALRVQKGHSEMISLSSESACTDIVVDQSYERPEDKLEKKNNLQSLEGLLKKLKKRDREIIQMRFGLKNKKALTLKEIGQVFNLSRERVRQIESEALAKLNLFSRQKMLKIVA